MIRVEQTIGSDKRIPFSVVWTDADRLSSTTPTRNAGSLCHTAVGELKLAGMPDLVSSSPVAVHHGETLIRKAAPSLWERLQSESL
jgi:hypothetical protein